MHLAAIIQHYKDETIVNKTNIDGTLNVIEASGNVKHLIFASSTLTLKPIDTYSNSKKKCEELLKKENISYTILRMGPVFGSDDNTNISKLIKLIKSGKTIPIPGDGKQIIQPVHIDDVVKAINTIILNRDFFRKTCTIVGDPISFNELIDEISKVLHRKKKGFHIPIGVLKPMIKVYQGISSNPTITLQQIENLEVLSDGGAIKSDFPTMPLNESIEKTSN